MRSFVSVILLATVASAASVLNFTAPTGGTWYKGSAQTAGWTRATAGDSSAQIFHLVLVSKDGSYSSPISSTIQDSGSAQTKGNIDLGNAPAGAGYTIRAISDSGAGGAVLGESAAFTIGDAASNTASAVAFTTPAAPIAGAGSASVSASGASASSTTKPSSASKGAVVGAGAIILAGLGAIVSL